MDSKAGRGQNEGVEWGRLARGKNWGKERTCREEVGIAHGSSQSRRQAGENRQPCNCFPPARHLREHAIGTLTPTAVRQGAPLCVRAEPKTT